MLLIGVIAGILSPNLFKEQTAEAVSSETSSQNVAILVREPRYFEIAIQTLINGKKTTSDSAIKETLRAASTNDIRLAACGISLAEAKMTEAQLLPGIQVVENGLWEMVRLQYQGFISVEL